MPYQFSLIHSLAIETFHEVIEAGLLLQKWARNHQTVRLLR